MKDLSLFLLKNALGAKMRKGFKNFCKNDTSTSTLNQQKVDHCGPICDVMQSFMDASYDEKSTALRESQTTTLEEMILQLELEEKMARRAKLDNEYGVIQHRMSCVNSSDILRSARNALNQYPRFSLDGKDAMYRSSFRNFAPVSTRTGLPMRCNHGYDIEAEETGRFPATLAGERVTWCKPGVVAKLMGLEAMPIPVRNYRREKLSAIIKRQNLRRRSERHELERRKSVSDPKVCSGMRRRMAASCSTTGYCVMKPVPVELPNGEIGWPMRRFL